MKGLDKYTTVELIEYITNIGFMTDFDTEEDTHKLAEIQGRLLELDKIKRNCGKRFYVEPTEIITKEGKEHFKKINKGGK